MRVINLNSKLMLIGLSVILLLLAIKFWFGADSIIKVFNLKTAIITQEQELNKIRLRNQQVGIKINNLKSSPAAIEEQARYELGMIKPGEKYYQVVEPIE